MEERLTDVADRSSVALMRAIAGASAAVALLLLAGAAHAGEDELIVAVEPAYAVLTTSTDAFDSPAHGFGLSASAWIGTPTALWVGASIGGTGHFTDPDNLGSVEVLLGLVYALDVFAAIPFVEAQAGILTSVVGDTGVQPSARFGLGFDYLVTRTMSLGLVARIRPTGSPLGDALITGQIRWAVRLEY